MELNALHLSPPPLATVLVVDADVVFREFEARTLIDHGYTVLKAGGKAEALRVARQNANIGLLVLGTPLQEPDRLELTHEFQKAHPEAPVLLVLESFEVFGDRFHSKGRLSVMAKPFELSELIDHVRRLLAEVHVQRQKTIRRHSCCMIC